MMMLLLCSTYTCCGHSFLAWQHESILASRLVVGTLSCISRCIIISSTGAWTGAYKEGAGQRHKHQHIYVLARVRCGNTYMCCSLILWAQTDSPALLLPYCLLLYLML